MYVCMYACMYSQEPPASYFLNPSLIHSPFKTPAPPYFSLAFCLLFIPESMVSLENQVSDGNKELLRLEHIDYSSPIPGICFLPSLSFFCFLIFFLTLSWQIVGSKLLSICKEKEKYMDKKKKKKNAQEFFQNLGESNGKYFLFNYENSNWFLLNFHHCFWDFRLFQYFICSFEVLNRVKAFLPILDESNKKLTMEIKVFSSLQNFKIKNRDLLKF